MTSADKFGIAFSIGFTVALIVIAMSFSATNSTPTAEDIELAPAPEMETPTMEEETEEEVMEETMEEEMVVEEEPLMEEETVEEEVMEEAEVEMSAEVSIPSGSSILGCEETDECFIPYTVTVGVGGTVTWTNDDSAAHTVTSGTVEDSESVGAIFDSSIVMSGKAFEYTFDEAGEYDYFCVVHPWMTGIVIVE